jgi:hypothetical protein
MSRKEKGKKEYNINNLEDRPGQDHSAPPAPAPSPVDAAFALGSGTLSSISSEMQHVPSSYWIYR